jgi:mono/diheme cytochrome c family protein
MNQRADRSIRWFLTALLLAAGVTGVSRADDAGSLATAKMAEVPGAQIYSHICQGCHMPQGEGAIGAGHYPKLAGDRALASWRYVALTVMGGKNGMPAFGMDPMEAGQTLSASLSDAQIADVVNYVRSHFGNHFKERVTSAEVAALRKPGAKAAP